MIDSFDHRQVETQAEDLVLKGDWNSVIELMARNRSQLLNPRTVMLFLIAAIEIRSAEAIRQAVLIAIERNLPPTLLADAATRLAAAGFGMAALCVLASDTGLLRPDAPNPRAIAALWRIAEHSDTDALLHSVAKALVRKLSGGGKTVRPPALREAASLRFHPSELSAVARQRQHALAVSASPKVAGRFTDEVLRLDQEFDNRTLLAKAPRLFEFTNVFVNKLGQVWDKSGILRLDGNLPLPEESRAAMDAAETVALAVLATDKTFGFYHWFAEWLPSLSWVPERVARNWAFLSLAGAPRFQQESLQLAFGGTPNIVEVNDAIFVKRLLVGERSISCMAFWDSYRPLFDTIVNQATSQYPADQLADRIYISRRESTRRVLENEQEVEAALASEFGFRTVQFGDMPLGEQVAIIQRASVIAAPHGAGLSHILAARSGTAVFEFMPVAEGATSLRFNFARLSRIRGHRHGLWLEPANPFSRRWSIDLPRATDALAAFLR